MAIITYGMWVAMSVAEEKGSRVMELMLNATTPLQMLAGKVIGNGAAGLTQYGIILAAVVGGLLAQGPIHQVVLGSGSGTPFGGLEPVVLAPSWSCSSSASCSTRSCTRPSGRW